MREIGAVIGKILGLVFGALVIGFTAWLTYLLAARIIPDNPILQAMCVILFDGGALIWFILFLTQAMGTAQWAVAGVGFAVGLVGAVIMAGGELLLGQSLVVLDNTEEIGWILVSTVIVAALCHATLTYAFHFTEPAVWNRIENNQRISKVQEKAYQTGRAEIDREAESMGKDLAASLVYQARAELAAAALPHLRTGASIESATAEALTSGLVIPAGPARGDATPQKSKINLPSLAWPKRGAKPAESDSDLAALKAELASLRAQVAAKPQPQPTYTPVSIESLQAYAAESTPIPSLRAVPPLESGPESSGHNPQGAA